MSSKHDEVEGALSRIDDQLSRMGRRFQAKLDELEERVMREVRRTAATSTMNALRTNDCRHMSSRMRPRFVPRGIRTPQAKLGEGMFKRSRYEAGAAEDRGGSSTEDHEVDSEDREVDAEHREGNAEAHDGNAEAHDSDMEAHDSDAEAHDGEGEYQDTHDDEEREIGAESEDNDYGEEDESNDEEGVEYVP